MIRTCGPCSRRRKNSISQTASINFSKHKNIIYHKYLEILSRRNSSTTYLQPKNKKTVECIHESNLK